MKHTNEHTDVLAEATRTFNGALTATRTAVWREDKGQEGYHFFTVDADGYRVVVCGNASVDAYDGAVTHYNLVVHMTPSVAKQFFEIACSQRTHDAK